MTKSEIDNGLAYLKTYIDRQAIHPGQIIMKDSVLIKSISEEMDISEKGAMILANLFISNGYIAHDSSFVKLTEEGYELLHNDKWPIPKLHLTDIFPSDDNISLEILFYNLWDIIGNDKEKNPYYVDGKTFYDIVKLYCVGLAPTYSDYIEELRLNKKSTSRGKWCKELFVSIGKGQINSFLAKLSDNINRIVEKYNQTIDSIEEDIQLIPIIDKTLTEINPMKKQKKYKIFISHNSEDKQYAKALVDMLSKLGLNEEKDIFCSSVPGCGVKFGNNFIDAILHEYKEYNLIILFIHSPRLYKSPVSLNEMGAGWVMRSEHKSFLTSDCSFDMLKGVITPQEIAFKAGLEETYHLLHEFKEFIEKSFDLKPKGPGRWDDIRNEFIKTVESIKYEN